MDYLKQYDPFYIDECTPTAYEEYMRQKQLTLIGSRMEMGIIASRGSRFDTLKHAINKMYGINNYSTIKNVIFNDPATIVFWNDGTKTVVKAEGEPFDPEKGLSMAISKKFFSNKGNYYNEFKKWLPKYEEPTMESDNIPIKLDEMMFALKRLLKSTSDIAWSITYNEKTNGYEVIIKPKINE